jgi:hypothetical protein
VALTVGVYVLDDTLLWVLNKMPPVAASYQLNVPEDEAEAESVAVVLPQVLPSVTVTDGTLCTVAATAARLLVHVPLSNST